MPDFIRSYYCPNPKCRQFLAKHDSRNDAIMPKSRKFKVENGKAVLWCKNCQKFYVDGDWNPLGG